MGDYLFESTHAEHDFLAHFHNYVDTVSSFIGSFGIAPRHAWYLIEIPMERLVSGTMGEVDVLAGNLEAENPEEFSRILHDYQKQVPNAHPDRHHNYAAMILALNGGLKWPPSMNHLVGIEVKSSYLPSTSPDISFEAMKSRNTSSQDVKKLRRSVNKLLQLGFDQVGLFELLAAPPGNGTGSQPWSTASYIASETLVAMSEAFEKRLPDESPVGHGVASISGVVGRAEFDSGSLSFDLLRKPSLNPLLEKPATQKLRCDLNVNLTEILRGLSLPLGMPAVFVYDKKNKTITHANNGWVSC